MREDKETVEHLVTCKKCAKAFGIDPDGAAVAAKTEACDRKAIKRIAVFVVILQDIRMQQGRTVGKETVESTTVVQNPTIHGNLLDLDLSRNFANIDWIGYPVPNTWAVQDYQVQNSEAATLYVPWARFVHEVEAFFVLKKIPTGIAEAGNIDIVHQHGSRYSTDQNGTCCLSTIRPLWLPALRSALDPLHKGYVKPQYYFNFLHDSSLSDVLRRLVLESAGYGTLVECERAHGGLSLPAEIESPPDHVGWISAQNTFKFTYVTFTPVKLSVIMPGATTFISLSSRHVTGSGTVLRQAWGRRLLSFSRGRSRIPSTKCYAMMTTPQPLPYRSLTVRSWGPSKTFSNPPKIGEKIQEESDSLFFPEEQLTQLGKGAWRLWRPWRRNIRKHDVRPYRCFHIGDTVEAPVIYPDFRYRYHLTSNLELYIPARIVDTQDDQYVIEFSPALSVHRCWPGRMPKGMDRVRPFSAGPRPVLGVKSAKPSGWGSFQGVRLCNFEDLLERSLWDNDRDSQQSGDRGWLRR
ncbi:hypothetical protein C7999DRAFT_39701 [Corynascus novoguineensis]|uniref:Uncharacterized protein n=1 Tax=Corynascus novoguineensis TaxID=1126955 RepID=A0AAN7CXM0_9PEZI|nr:hypothetical protein C7999DRAFT_39701 [Corynascus novoguineensis]